MRAPSATAAVVAFAAALLAGCGREAPPPPVRLTVAAPSDEQILRSPTVEVRGTVRPATATVMVDGRAAPVSEGAWRATVSLSPGTNVIDVLASAGRAHPALTAIRVRRRVSVRVPDVVGLTAADATAVLEDRGLKAEVDDRDGIISRLLPGDPKACVTDPAAGDEVDPGTTVTVSASRSC